MKVFIYTLLHIIFFAPFVTYAQYDPRSTQQTVDTFSISMVIEWFVKTVEIVLGISLIYTILIVLIAGILFLTSGGDEDRMDKAIRWWKQSAVVLIAIPLIYLLISAAGNFFGAQLT
jgi:hypothetical protein